MEPAASTAFSSSAPPFGNPRIERSTLRLFYLSAGATAGQGNRTPHQKSTAAKVQSYTFWYKYRTVWNAVMLQKKYRQQLPATGKCKLLVPPVNHKPARVDNFFEVCDTKCRTDDIYGFNDFTIVKRADAHPPGFFWIFYFWIFHK